MSAPPTCKWSTTWNPYYTCDEPATVLGIHDEDGWTPLCKRHRCAYVRFNKERGGKIVRL